MRARTTFPMGCSCTAQLRLNVPNLGWRRKAIGIVLVGIACGCGAAESVTLVDFARAGHGWKGNARTRDARQDGGFCVDLTGAEDPWLEGPAVAVPDSGRAQKLELTLEATCVGRGEAFQLFYAPEGAGFSAERATVLVRVSPASPQYAGFVPVLSARMRFRLDPPGTSGRVTLVALRARPLMPRMPPPFVKPVAVPLPDDALRLEAGQVSIAHDPRRWNALVWSVGGQPVAETSPDEVTAYLAGDAVVPVPLGAARLSVEREAAGFTVRATLRDADGADWTLSRSIRGGSGAVRVETAVSVSEAREVVHLPWLTFFAGAGTFGERKSQALLPGVEYLEDEPSSNEKEVRGPAANRRLVSAHKVCYPMMALAADGRWLSLAWEPGDVPVTPLFDSPDRVFSSGGHVLGLWSPAVGDARFDGELVVYGGVRLEAARTYRCVATLSGGRGGTATEAVVDYVARHGLPDLPTYAGGFEGAVRLLAHGWLDSVGRDGLRWRHAVWGDRYPAQPAQDPPAYMLWLAAHMPDPALKARLLGTSQAVIASLPVGCFGTDGISHVRRPVGALLYGHLEGLVKEAGPRAMQLAKRLADGKARYRPGKVDYASTLGSDHCNGYTALAAEEMLVEATLTGDEVAIAESLKVLEKLMANYAGQVPRGAQPWEMPLHTPDIVASARLVRCHVLGYLLSANPAYLEQARYWAWTGVTMVYLAAPTKGAVGRYATIGVMGATNWEAPNWIGQPVQWCGLVYRSALEELARVDDAQRDTWQRLARGITIAGLQMCFPADDPQRRGGLLPDYFLLKAQIGDGPAINPGTVQAHLAEVYGKTPLYTVTRLAKGSLVHAPGEVRQEAVAGGVLKLAVTAWPEDTYRILITRLDKPPASMTWNGDPVSPQWIEGAGVVIVSLKGSGTLSVAP